VPIYAYRCTSCGHAQDVLQKLSDPLLEVCPQCGASAFVKQVTAAGFQLKGSGWYVTDFRGGNTGAAKKEGDAAAAPAAADGAAKTDAAGAKADAAAKPAAEGQSSAPSGSSSGSSAPSETKPAAPAAGSTSA
jgi:putative FmdB family regulatory protein